MDKSKNTKTMPKSLVASVMQSAMATDYRIGNIIQYNNEIESIGTITSLIADFVAGLYYCQIDYRNNKKHRLINVKPIEITEEWLEKLGFVRDEETSYRWFILDRTIAYDLDDNCIRISDSWEFGKRKYVHELQNLYYCLTQTELAVA